MTVYVCLLLILGAVSTLYADEPVDSLDAVDSLETSLTGEEIEALPVRTVQDIAGLESETVDKQPYTGELVS